MPTTTFAGPVKAGGISTSTGNILGENVANQGFAKMVQVAAVTESASGDPDWTDIVIPANSQIIRIAALVTTVFTGANSYVGKGDGVGENSWFAFEWDLTSLGLLEVTTDFNTAYEEHWKDTGSEDLHVTFYNIGGGSGVATLIIEYVQNNNLTE